MSRKHDQATPKKLIQSPVQSKEVIKKLNAYRTISGSLLFLFAFLLYAQSIHHEYTLDDHPVIDENEVTTKGLVGIPTILTTDYWYGFHRDELRGPVYRPTSKVTFAILWEFFPDKPKIYHLVNVLLFAASCWLLFLVLHRMLPSKPIILPFIASLFYAAHPIHTEVVNNIKSLDEILCFLFGLLSILFLLKYDSSKSKVTFILSGIFYFLSLVSKETGIAFLPINLIIIYFYSINFKKTFINVSLLLVIITALWLVLRSIIFRDLPPDIGILSSPINNTLNAASGFVSRYATVFYILLKYVGLLIFPYPLTCDYNYAQIKIQTLGDPGALLGIALYAFMGIYIILKFSSKSIVVFSMLVFLLPLAPVSNFFFLGGSSMAERFMYIPSLGFCILLAYLVLGFFKLDELEKTSGLQIRSILRKPIFLLVVFGITLLFSIQTYSRSKHWKNTMTIYNVDVITSSNSATANQIFGSALMVSALESTNQTQKADTFRLAKNYLLRSVEIYPHYFAPYSHLGVVYLSENMLDSAFYYLDKGLKMAPEDVDLNFNLGLLFFMQKRNSEAIERFDKTVLLLPEHENAFFNLAGIYYNTREYDKALLNFNKVLELNPSNANAFYYAGNILNLKGDSIRGKEYLKRAEALGHKRQ